MNKYLKFFILLIIPINLFAHSLILNLIDNEDGTITIAGEFSTGESASGALVKIVASQTKETILEKRLDDESEITVKIPSIKYDVILDGGPNHTAKKPGIEPPEGFKETKKEKKVQEEKNTQISLSYKVLFTIAFLLFALTILISIYNTNKILKESKKLS